MQTERKRFQWQPIDIDCIVINLNIFLPMPYQINKSAKINRINEANSTTNFLSSGILMLVVRPTLQPSVQPSKTTERAVVVVVVVVLFKPTKHRTSSQRNQNMINAFSLISRSLNTSQFGFAPVCKMWQSLIMCQQWASGAAHQPSQRALWILQRVTTMLTAHVPLRTHSQNEIISCCNQYISRLYTSWAKAYKYPHPQLIHPQPTYPSIRLCMDGAALMLIYLRYFFMLIGKSLKPHVLRLAFIQHPYCFNAALFKIHVNGLSPWEKLPHYPRREKQSHTF